MFRRRASGVLMHLTSLPSPYGIGDLGPEAYDFVDFLQQAGQLFWQILPINYTTAQTGYSPYNCFSAFAGNILLISPDQLVTDGWLDKTDVSEYPSFPVDRVDFKAAAAWRRRLLNRAFTRFQSQPVPPAFETFVRAQADWLEDFALFVVLKQRMGRRPWCDWPKEIRDRQKRLLQEMGRELQQEIQRVRFFQYLFWQQMAALRHYCHGKGIHLMGDVPIYVAYDSADVWTHPYLFKLDRDKRPKFKAGVPPDYFSRTGQLWGNPVYDWPRMAKDDYGWFVNRIAHNLRWLDVVRIDHFRGLSAYWQVPARHKTAVGGTWEEGPGEFLFRALFKKLPFAGLFAEDLGYITADVRELMRQFDLPGIKVLQFAFGKASDTNGHWLHNHADNFIVCTGTHDNNTSRGWFEEDATDMQRHHLSAYCGRKVSARSVAWDLIRLAFTSVARVAMVPMQDLLNLGSEARMNHPAQNKGNWQWRMKPKSATGKLAERLRELTQLTGRL